MFNYNSGYVGWSRSVRSAEAIANFEVPASKINKVLIADFVETLTDEARVDPENAEFSLDDIEILKKIPAVQWRYAVEVGAVKASSWHHTSKFYSQTNHYDLRVIATYILKSGAEKLKAEYTVYRKATATEKIPNRYGYIRVQVWGGSRNHRKLKGEQDHYGIVVGSWLHCLRGGSKLKTDANKVVHFEEFSDFEELTEKHPDCPWRDADFVKLIDQIVK